jgi:hypothetical protein
MQRNFKRVICGILMRNQRYYSDDNITLNGMDSMLPAHIESPVITRNLINNALSTDQMLEEGVKQYVKNEILKRLMIQEQEVYAAQLNFITALNGLRDCDKIEIGNPSPVKFQRQSDKSLKVCSIHNIQIRYTSQSKCWAATAYYRSPNHPAVSYARALRDYLMEVPGVVGKGVKMVHEQYQKIYNSSFACSWRNSVSSKGHSMRKVFTAAFTRTLQGLAKLMKLKPKNLELIVSR